jgi:hypothetical protein
MKAREVESVSERVPEGLHHPIARESLVQGSAGKGWPGLVHGKSVLARQRLEGRRAVA